MDTDLTQYGLYEQSGSGSVSGSGAVEYVFKGVRGAAAKLWEELEQAAKAGEFWRSGYINFGSCKISSDAAFDTVFIVTGKRPSATPGGGERNEGDTVTNLSLNYMEKQIETHRKYRTNWSYDLFVSIEATESNLTNPAMPPIPEFWEKAKDTYIQPADQKKFRWGQSTPPDQVIKDAGGKDKTYRWLLLAARTKAGILVYPVTAPVVTERIFFRTEKRAEDNLRLANTHHAPAKTYIYGREAENWIVQPQGVEESGGYFVTVNQYTYADQWDADIWED